jgi:hypothetical protein
VDFEFFYVKETAVFLLSSHPKESSRQLLLDGADFFPRFMDLAFFSVPSVIDSVASTPSPSPPTREKPLSWNGQRNTGKSLCTTIFNLQVFLHQ